MNIFAGSFIAGAVGALIATAATAQDAPPPYSYEIGVPDAADAAGELAALVPGATAQGLTLHAKDAGRAVATGQVVTLPDGGEVIVGWAADAKEPVLRSDILAGEELSLITALRKHLPENSTVLAMPATSARLAHFVDADFPLAADAGRQTLRIPAPWSGQADAVDRAERRWTPGAGGDGTAFATFTDALLSEDVYGAARLQVLAGPKDSFIILHVRDIFDLGISVPDRIHVSQRDFSAAGIAHDKSRAVKDWLRTHDLAAYTVQRRDGGAIRAYFLADAKDKSTLLGQLLPFDTADIGRVAGTSLVYQTGGYWIYRLQPITGGATGLTE